MEHNIDHKYFEGVNINYSIQRRSGESHIGFGQALSRSYSHTVRSDLAFAVGYQSASEEDWGFVSVDTPIRMVLP